METKGRKKHRGALLEEVVKASNTNISKMVQRLGISRGTYYNHKSDPNLSLEQLAAYGQVLKHDFSGDIPEMKRLVFEEGEVSFGKPKTMEEALEQRDYWREKYYQLMERYNKIIEEKLGE